MIEKQSLLRHNLDSQVAEQRRNKNNRIDHRQLSDFELERQRSKRDEKALYDAVSEETVTGSQVPIKERDTYRHAERETGDTATDGNSTSQFPGEFGGGGGKGGGIYRGSPEPKRQVSHSLAPISEETQDESLPLRDEGSRDVLQEGTGGGTNIVARGVVGDDVRASIKDIVSSQVSVS
jgi:hypothetical protein